MICTPNLQLTISWTSTTNEQKLHVKSYFCTHHGKNPYNFKNDMYLHSAMIYASSTDLYHKKIIHWTTNDYIYRKLPHITWELRCTFSIKQSIKFGVQTIPNQLNGEKKQPQKFLVIVVNRWILTRSPSPMATNQKPTGKNPLPLNPKITSSLADNQWKS